MFSKTLFYYWEHSEYTGKRTNGVKFLLKNTNFMVHCEFLNDSNIFQTIFGKNDIIKAHCYSYNSRRFCKSFFEHIDCNSFGNFKKMCMFVNFSMKST